MKQFDYNSPNTRARIAARRRRSNVPRDESAVLPGPRRAVGAWIATGRVASLPLFFAALAGLIYVSVAPHYSVRDIRVEGAQVLRPEDVVELSGALGRSIWLVDAEQVAERVGTSAYVEDVGVSLALPDQLTIRVVERRPEVRWQQGGTLYLVDASGRVLGVDASAPVTDTLVIEDRSAQPLEPNDHVDLDALQLGRTLTLRLPAELGLHPAHFAWNVDTGIVVTTPDRRTIVFGQSRNLNYKLVILRKLLEEQTAFTFLDLRPETPYYRNE